MSPQWTDLHKIWHRGRLADLIARFKFCVDRFRDFGSSRGRILPLSIDLAGRPLTRGCVRYSHLWICDRPGQPAQCTHEACSMECIDRFRSFALKESSVVSCPKQYHSYGTETPAFDYPLKKQHYYFIARFSLYTCTQSTLISHVAEVHRCCRAGPSSRDTGPRVSYPGPRDVWGACWLWKIQSTPTPECAILKNKKSELMLMRRTRAYI